MQKSCQYCQKTFITRRNKQVFCSILCANRCHLNHKFHICLPKKFSKELAELFGVLLGDGGVERYFVRIYLNRKADRGYPQVLIALIKKLFPDVVVTCLDRPGRGTEEVQVSSVDVCNYLRSIGFDPKQRSVPSWILAHKNFIKATIRGLFDTEGSIGIKNYAGQGGRVQYFQLTVTNKNAHILYFLETELTKLGYKPTKNSQKNIYISNKKDIQRYFTEIGTSNPKLKKKFDEAKKSMGK